MTTTNTLERKPKNDRSTNLAQVMDQLVRLLARRDHSECELKQKLTKFFAHELVDKAIHMAHSHRWLADENELAQRVAKTLSEKKKGQNYIRHYLRRKGLPAVEMDAEMELEKAHQLLTQKFGSEELSRWGLDLKTKQKAYRFLMNRGFEDHTIRKALSL